MILLGSHRNLTMERYENCLESVYSITLNNAKAGQNILLVDSIGYNLCYFA